MMIEGHLVTVFANKKENTTCNDNKGEQKVKRRREDLKKRETNGRHFWKSISRREELALGRDYGGSIGFTRFLAIFPIFPVFLLVFHIVLDVTSTSSLIIASRLVVGGQVCAN